MSTQEIKFGEFESEKQAKQNTECREIVKEILNFGVNDNMILMIINLLALNLENNLHMLKIVDVIRNLDNVALFISDKSEEINS